MLLSCYLLFQKNTNDDYNDDNGDDDEMMMISKEGGCASYMLFLSYREERQRHVEMPG